MTGTGCDHEHNEAVILAAQWLADLKDIPQPIVPTIKTRFGLTSVEACEVIRRAQQMRTYRRVYG